MCPSALEIVHEAVQSHIQKLKRGDADLLAEILMEAVGLMIGEFMDGAYDAFESADASARAATRRRNRRALQLLQRFRRTYAQLLGRNR